MLTKQQWGMKVVLDPKSGNQVEIMKSMTNLSENVDFHPIGLELSRNCRKKSGSHVSTCYNHNISPMPNF